MEQKGVAAVESSQRSALDLMSKNMAELYRLVPLAYDGEVLRIAATAEYAAWLDDLPDLLGIGRVEAEYWPGERVTAALAEAYPADPLGDALARAFPPGRRAAVFDAAHGLPSVAEVFASRECCGVSRFREQSGEWPALTLTVSWGQSGAWVERVSEFVSLGPAPQQVEPASAWAAWVPRHLLPRPLRGWPAATAAFAAAPSVNRLAGVHGLWCDHSWASSAGTGEAEWVWPDGRDRGQWRLIGAYWRLVSISWLCSWRSPPADMKKRLSTRGR